MKLYSGQINLSFFPFHHKWCLFSYLMFTVCAINCRSCMEWMGRVIIESRRSGTWNAPCATVRCQSVTTTLANRRSSSRVSPGWTTATRVQGVRFDFFFNTGYPRHRENRENDSKKIPVRENTGNLEILPKHRENTGNFVWSSCIFPDSKGKGYCDICRENFHFFSEAG